MIVYLSLWFVCLSGGAWQLIHCHFISEPQITTTDFFMHKEILRNSQHLSAMRVKCEGWFCSMMWNVGSVSDFETRIFFFWSW